MEAFGILMLAQAVSGAAAVDGVAPPPAAYITRPAWVRRPRAEDLARNYPGRAVHNNISGAAVMVCRVDAAGELEACRITEVEPKDQGFDEATLRLAERFKMRAIDEEGMPTAGRAIRIPVR